MVLKLLFRPLFIYLSRIIDIYRLKRKYPGLKIGDYVTIVSSSFMGGNSIASNSLISECEFGEYSYSSSNVFMCRAKIGKFTCIGPNVTIGLARHPLGKFASIHPMFYSASVDLGASFIDINKFEEKSEEVHIGNDVWIGEGVTIPGGVIIGDGSVIAAGAVVVKNVEAYTIVGGIPARRIKYRYNEETRLALIQMAWWDQSQNWLKQHSDYFEDVEKLISVWKSG
jgi:acetyltransferase-like isoleucine patch superfamily enzyme